MLFNSFPFIFGFLPPALAGYWLLNGREGARLWFLLAVSLIFYSYWDWRLTPLLIASILVNWAAIRAFTASQSKSFLIAAIVANLLCLGVFKYLGFFGGVVEDISGARFDLPRLVLPLGISFYTFHHIIYLADLMAGRAPGYSFRDYALYIALFPQILAGPLVRHNEIIPQFPLAPLRPGWDERICRGVALFLIGLFKKIFLGDSLEVYCGPLFAAADQGPVTVGGAWTAVLAGPLQAYFDFSGYSDMAIGLALLLGFTLPVNFNMPFKASSISELWRRWHMTLMRFLRDYLFVPMGGVRRRRQLTTIVITFTLAGLWHGANWTFILWGFLQGLGIAAGALWRRQRLPEIPARIGWLLTMIFVVFTFFIFRAHSLTAMGRIYSAMLGMAAPGPVAGIPLLALSAAVVLIAPSSQAFVARLTPRSWLAPVAAVATVVALLKLGDGPSYEFMYFHF